MLTGDLFLARVSCFPQASLVSSVGSHTVLGLWRQTHCRLPALAANSIGLSRTGFDFTTHSFFTARRSYASAVLGVVILSVRLSVCLSHACFVTNSNNRPAIFLYHTKGQSF